MSEKQNNLRLKIVSQPEELQQAFAVRALVYIGEQNCPWNEEFDGNDFSATQILGLINGEPVATARIRWFHEFAKLERLGIRKEFRGAGYGRQLLEYLIWVCRSKGFSHIYLHAQERLHHFYAQYGFISKGNRFYFSDHAYLAMSAYFPNFDQKVDLEINPLIVNRPEGRWDATGILERSANRNSMPSVFANSVIEEFIPSYF